MMTINMEEEDDFWSVAMNATANGRRATYKDESDGEEKKCTSQLFTILPTTNAPMQKPMNIKLCIVIMMTVSYQMSLAQFGMQDYFLQDICTGHIWEDNFVIMLASMVDVVYWS